MNAQATSLVARTAFLKQALDTLSENLGQVVLKPDLDTALAGKADTGHTHEEFVTLLTSMMGLAQRLSQRPQATTVTRDAQGRLVHVNEVFSDGVRTSVYTYDDGNGGRLDRLEITFNQSKRTETYVYDSTGLAEILVDEGQSTGAPVSLMSTALSYTPQTQSLPSPTVSLESQLQALTRRVADLERHLESSF
jgi:ribosomal protein S15P/S13E